MWFERIECHARWERKQQMLDSFLAGEQTRWVQATLAHGFALSQYIARF
jgi:hypothetical protein